ncbi:MAG: hypothetical protein D6767_07055, partial [Candidatus Hydrogenedentota bacterium]
MKIRFIFCILFIGTLPDFTFALQGAAYYKSQGDFQVAQRNPLKALELYKKALQINPDYVPALLAIGKLYRNLGALKSASQNLHRALSKSGPDASVLLEMGSVYRQLGALQKSLEALKQAHRLSKKNTEIMAQLALTYLELGNLKKARDWISKGKKEKPDSPQFRLLLARTYLMEGRPRRAKRILQIVLKSNPRNFEANLLLALILNVQGKTKKALMYAKKAVSIQPQSPRTHYVLASILLEQKLRKLRQNLSRFPKEEDFLNIIETLENARGYDESYIPALSLMAKVYLLLPQGCQKAKDSIESILSINPNHYVGRYLKGFCQKKHIPEVYSTMLNERPNDEITRQRLEASLWNQQLKELLLQQAHFHYARGISLSHAHRTDSAVYEFFTTLHLFPSHKGAHKHLAEYYRTLGDFISLQKELEFLRNITKNVTYTDRIEQIIRARKKKIYYTENLRNIENLKTPTPVFLMYGRPTNLLGNYPDAGEAFAEKLHLAIRLKSKIAVFSFPVWKKVMQQIQNFPHVGYGGYYSGETGDFLNAPLVQYAEKL